MQLHTNAVQVDFFPIGTGKRFVQRTAVQLSSGEYVSFRTVTRSEALYDAQCRLAKGAEMVDFHTEEYQGTDYRPLFC